MAGEFQDVRIGVVIALVEEFNVFLDYVGVTERRSVKIDDTIIEVVTTDSGHKIAVLCIDGMGNPSSAVATTRLLEAFPLSCIVNLGLAGGVSKKKQALGDIIVAERIVYLESGKISNEGFLAAPEYVDIRSRLISQIKIAGWERWPLGTSIGGRPRSVHFGTLASGEKVIAKAAHVASILQRDRTIVGIEMESYGVALAAHKRHVATLVIRGISDLADEKKADFARLNAMEGAIRFFKYALMQLGGLLEAPSPNHISDRPWYLTTSLMYVKSGNVRGFPIDEYRVSRSLSIDRARYRRDVINRIATEKSLGEIKALCVSLEVDPDDIAGETRIEKVASLVQYLERRRILTIEELDILTR